MASYVFTASFSVFIYLYGLKYNSVFVFFGTLFSKNCGKNVNHAITYQSYFLFKIVSADGGYDQEDTATTP